MKLSEYVESRLCVSSGLGKNMSLLSTILLYIHLRKLPLLLLTLPYLYIDRNLIPMVVKLVFNTVISFHCDRDERRHCQFQCNVYG